MGLGHISRGIVATEFRVKPMFGGRLGPARRTLWSLYLLAAFSGACSAPYRAAIEIEGQWVGEKSWTGAQCDSPPACELMIDVAAAVLHDREPSANIEGARFHDIPRTFADGGAVTVSTIQTHNVVFTLDDGLLRLQSFSCGLDGLVGTASPSYAPFCP